MLHTTEKAEDAIAFPPYKIKKRLTYGSDGARGNEASSALQKAKFKIEILEA